MESLQFSRSDKFLMTINGIILLTSLMSYVIFWVHLPDAVPMHFSGLGKVDSWGPKGSALVLLLIMTSTVSIVLFLRNSPQYFNFPVKVHDGNRERQVGIIRNLMATIAIHISLITHVIIWSIIAGAFAWNSVPYLMAVVLILILSILINTGISVYLSFRAR